jgi:hypothetical protein
VAGSHLVTLDITPELGYTSFSTYPQLISFINRKKIGEEIWTNFAGDRGYESLVVRYDDNTSVPKT